MARLSKEERAELGARLAEDDQDDDDDRQATVSIGDRSFTGAMRDVRNFAAAHGFKLTPDPAPDKDEDKKPSNVKRFNSGRRTG